MVVISLKTSRKSIVISRCCFRFQASEFNGTNQHIELSIVNEIYISHYSNCGFIYYSALGLLSDRHCSFAFHFSELFSVYTLLYYSQLFLLNYIKINHTSFVVTNLPPPRTLLSISLPRYHTLAKPQSLQFFFFSIFLVFSFYSYCAVTSCLFYLIPSSRFQTKSVICFQFSRRHAFILKP